MSRLMLYGFISWAILCSFVAVRADDAEDKAVEFVKTLKGNVARDARLPGKPVLSVVLYGPQVTDEALKELAAFKNLTMLILNTTQVTDAGLAELAGLTKLNNLTLNRTKVTDAGFKVLAGLKDLTTLNLLGTRVTNAGLKELAALKKLTNLSLGGSQALDGTQLPQLGIGGQAVAALGLAGGGAARHHLVEARARCGDEIVLGRLPGRGYRPRDAAALIGNLAVGRPRQAALDLAAPVPRKHRMGVRIDEAGHHRAPPRVDAGRAAGHLHMVVERGGGASVDDHPVEGRHHRAGERRHLALGGPQARRGPRARHEEVGVLDEKIGGRHGGSSTRRLKVKGQG